ncbi:MAG: helix-turn-helix domain-containing protein [Acutalibacteraceae bacterium]
MDEQRIKQDSIHIGQNIRNIRKKNIGQTQLAVKMQLYGVDVTRETIVKIERGVRHISASE